VSAGESNVAKMLTKKKITEWLRIKMIPLHIHKTAKQLARMYFLRGRYLVMAKTFSF